MATQSPALENLVFRQIAFNSAEQLLSIQLREEVLRIPLGLRFTPEELAAEHDQVHLAALQNEQVLGILLFKKLDRHTLKMRQVAVKPEVQRAGVGKALVSFAELWARERGFKRIEMHARFNAVPFYAKLGYLVEGEEFEEVGIPHFKMYKEL